MEYIYINPVPIPTFSGTFDMISALAMSSLNKSALPFKMVDYGPISRTIHFLSKHDGYSGRRDCQWLNCSFHWVAVIRHVKSQRPQGRRR